MVTCPNDTAQAAAIEALENGNDDPQEFKRAYRQRRDKLASAMRKMGFEIALPDGAFYIFAKIPAQFGKDDLAFARKLAHEAKVGVIPEMHLVLVEKDTFAYHMQRQILLLIRRLNGYKIL